MSADLRANLARVLFCAYERESAVEFEELGRQYPEIQNAWFRAADAAIELGQQLVTEAAAKLVGSST